MLITFKYMIKHISFALLAAVASVLIGCSSTKKSTKGHSAYLFNGKNTKGWIAANGGTWSVEEGFLIGSNGQGWSTDPQKSGSWLRTQRPYNDFLLELEYSINQGGNSGIFIRSGLEKNPAFTGYEIQILDDHGKPPSKSTSGALYDVVAPTRNMSRPAGEWNEVRVLVKGTKVQVSLNGVLVVDTEATRATNGFVGLQAHDEKSRVRFRNVRLTEL